MKAVWVVSVLVSVHLSVCWADSCYGRCGQGVNSAYSCQCNTACQIYQDCCSDYGALCRGESCALRCDQPPDSSYFCQCNSACERYNDCCIDYSALCTAGGDTLSSVMQDIWNSDVNRLPDTAYTVSSSGSKYFTHVDEGMMGTTFQLFIALLNNYNRNIGQPEVLSATEKAEEDAFLDAILNTEVMQIALVYLQYKEKVSSLTDFRATLRELWFDFYPRSNGGVVDSSGFEHVFVGERTSSSVSGFHSWVQFYLQEKAGNLVFHQQVSTAEPYMRAASFTWYGGKKSKGSFFLGSSPEYDLAVYTICALSNQNSRCNFGVNGSSVSVQTYDISHKTGNQIGSAYPAI